LSSSPYQFTAWDATQPAGSYPPCMIFTMGTNVDPGLNVELSQYWTLPYDRTNRCRIVGLGADGVGFINTSDPQADGGGYVGAAVLGLRTVGLTNVQLQFMAGTVVPNSRVYGLRLQARVGDGATNAFQDVRSDIGQPIEYVSS